MRSALDPLPRSLSIRSLAILVTMLVAGIAISVHEYMESGRIIQRSSTVRSAIPAARHPTRIAEELRPTSSAASVESGPVTTSAPGLWIPESKATGS